MDIYIHIHAFPYWISIHISTYIYIHVLNVLRKKCVLRDIDDLKNVGAEKYMDILFKDRCLETYVLRNQYAFRNTRT